MFPTRNTFIHFSVPSHDTRSRSAPPTVTPTSTPTRPQLQIKRRRRRRQQKEKTDDDDDILTLEEFARKSIRENWTLWAKKLCYQSRQEAKCEIDVMRLHLTLPWHLFNDWAFHTFLVFNRPEALPQLFRTSQLRHCHMLSSSTGRPGLEPRRSELGYHRYKVSNVIRYRKNAWQRLKTLSADNGGKKGIFGRQPQ